MEQKECNTADDMPTSSSRPEPSPEDLKTIDELMSSGKRNYVCGDYNLALDSFVELCKEAATFYGEVGDECAEPYLYYGKTLLEIARLENGVLGHALKETPVLGEGEDTDTAAKTEDECEDGESAEDKKIDIPEMVQHAMRDGNLYNDSTEDDLTEDEDQADEKPAESSKVTGEPEEKSNEVEEKDSKVEEKVEVNSKKSEEEEMEEENDGDEDNDDDKDEEDDVSHLQLSWEMFELCAFICNRQLKRGKTDKKLKSFLAEAKYGLAQISMESEHYEDAITDFSECLEHYKEILEDKNDRRLAEVNYNIALALSFDKQFVNSIEKYKLAVSIMEARVADLEGKVKEAEEKGGKGKASPELEEWTKEIKELQDIVILDMIPKIEDAEEMKKQADASIQVIKEATKEIFSSVGTSNGFDSGFDAGFDQPTNISTEAVHDITNKVRSSKVSMRKTDDDDAVEAKKAKTTSDSDLKENGVSSAAAAAS